MTETESKIKQHEELDRLAGKVRDRLGIPKDSPGSTAISSTLLTIEGVAERLEEKG